MASAYPSVLQQPPQKSPALGIIGCVAVIVLGVIFSVLYYQVGVIMGSDVDFYGSPTIDYNDPELMRLAMPTGLVGIVGLGAFIVSIVATATKRGRGWGVAGIILGVFAPIIGLVMCVVGAMSSVPF